MPAAAPHKSRLHADDRRRQLLKAAVESFAQKGFAGTKTKDIAASAGVSEAILFRHFASKEDLYHAILDTKEGPGGKDEFMGKLQDAAQRRDDTLFFLMLAEGIVKSFRDDPAFHRLILYASLEGHLLASLVRTRFGLPMGNFLRRYIATRQKEGAFVRCDPDAAVAYAFGTIVNFALARYVFGINDIPLEDAPAVKELVTLIVRGLKK
jgi:TetR/AcrR family transcriptional regulator